MNDDIERINEQNRKLNEPSEGNFSKAAFSHITTPQEDNKRSIAEGIIADLGNQRIDIDSIKQAIQMMSEQMNQLTTAFNNLGKGSNPQAPTQALNMDSISAIGELVEKGAAAYKSLRGHDVVTDSFTQQITDNAKAEAIESLNIVHLINKKVKGKLVADIAGDIAGNVINDSNKTNLHDPE